MEALGGQLVLVWREKACFSKKKFTSRYHEEEEQRVYHFSYLYNLPQIIFIDTHQLLMDKSPRTQDLNSYRVIAIVWDTRPCPTIKSLALK
jgi:hypothetical protein